MNKIVHAISCIVLLGSLMMLAGCTKQEKTVSGVLIGAGSGALIGGAAGGGGGAIAGAAIGGIGGGLIGNSMGDDK